ncbi:family 43 glycosylhydrolase [Microlunatus flavus]|uniref:Glycosyl hydrolases family 43 n=1 Tax=Microlunatus flavus TaxID=1036181 RepID=A0A1H9FWU9_9ACTN|nr:family 43 glycosylhydrolase [Microlunatus flavus]SEQ42381.1 Glycosyl hydrolases family 43 [Microlunatus flavus]
MKRLPRTAAVLAAAAALVGTTALPALAAPPVVQRPTYRNPVSAGFADTFADPSVIRGKDGWWYAYGTSDPLREGSTTPAQIPVARSRDMATWTSVGEAFSAANRPSWAAPGAALWAPDIRYVDGQYRLYYVVTDTTLYDAKNQTGDSAVGMATAPTPAGPWTDSGAPVVAPRPGAAGAAANDFLWTFDPSAVTDGGRQYLFYGSYYGGIYVSELAADGRTTTGKATQVALDNKFEGAYVVRHGSYWYLFASTANCCAGPTTGYSVQVGRSKKITGPYVDAQGVSLTASRTGGTPVLNQNGNRWVGAGHNAVATDLAGRDWIVYHAIDRGDPYLNGTSGINQRPMLIDRLDWVDGWPAVRGGRGPSTGEQQGPAAGGRWSTDLTSGLPARWRTTGGWAQRTEQQSGGYVRSTGAASVVSARVGASARVEADLRSAGADQGLTLRSGSTTVRAVVDLEAGRLRLQERRGGKTVDASSTRLPQGYAADEWHSVALQVREGRASATVTQARLGDPVASTDLRVRKGSTVDRAGAFADGAGVDVDNLSALPVAKPVTRLAPTPVPDRLDRAASDSFTGKALAPGWSWVRKDPAATVTDGELRWPTEAADLTGTGNDAGVLLRDPGAGAWTVETKLTIDLGTDDVRNYQQAGLVAYVDDDQFVRLSHVAIFNTRQTELGHETPYAGGLSYGGTIVGPPARTTWLRLTHTVDQRNGEHELRGWTSRDGRTWVKGGVWTLPAGSDVKVGLVSHGGAGATARFGWFRVYR